MTTADMVTMLNRLLEESQPDNDALNILVVDIQHDIDTLLVKAQQLRAVAPSLYVDDLIHGLGEVKSKCHPMFQVALRRNIMRVGVTALRNTLQAEVGDEEAPLDH